MTSNVSPIFLFSFSFFEAKARPPKTQKRDDAFFPSAHHPRPPTGHYYTTCFIFPPPHFTQTGFYLFSPPGLLFSSLPFFCAGSCVRETERMGDLRLQPGSQALPPPPPLSMPASPISPPPSELIAHTFPNKRKKGENPKEYVPIFFSGKVRELSRETRD